MDSRPVAYSSVAMALHWIIAAFVIGLFTLGLSFDSIPRASRPWWINLHTLFGMLLFVLVLVRLAWRIGHPPPPLPDEISPLLRKLSTAMHHTIYLILIAGPIVGMVAYVWHARVFDFGLFKLDFGVANTKSVYEPAEEIHKALAFLLIGLVVLHGLAALWHHFVRRDGLLWRMLPRRSA